jgi:hypothetical protein
MRNRGKAFVLTRFLHANPVSTSPENAIGKNWFRVILHDLLGAATGVRLTFMHGRYW